MEIDNNLKKFANFKFFKFYLCIFEKLLKIVLQFNLFFIEKNQFVFFPRCCTSNNFMLERRFYVNIRVALVKI